MATEGAESESDAAAASLLPEKIGTADLEALNQAVAALMAELRIARGLPAGETHGRQGAVAALIAVWRFLTRFEPVMAERLHVPLMSLHSALLALHQNNIEPILKPAKRTGRAISSSRRYALIGTAVGATQRLEWIGLSPEEANKAVAGKLKELGIQPTRGKKGIAADTLRRWREQINETRPLLWSLRQSQLRLFDISDEDTGWITAAIVANGMVTLEWLPRLAAAPLAEARRYVLSSLEDSIREMDLADPPKSPS
jgi:hypothetical protein